MNKGTKIRWKGMEGTVIDKSAAGFVAIAIPNESIWSVDPADLEEL